MWTTGGLGWRRVLLGGGVMVIVIVDGAGAGLM